MSILAAPYLDSKLPAQYTEGSNPQLNFIFSLNRSVGNLNGLQSSTVQLKIKTISTNKVVGLVENAGPLEEIVKGEKYRAYFSLTNIPLEMGTYYKAQIAFIDNGDVGNYSQPGIFKYTYYPELKILGQEEQELIDYQINSNRFTGFYKSQDYSEKVAEYRFIVFDEDDNIFEDTEYQVHNSFQNDSYDASKDIFSMRKELQPAKNYYIVYQIKTFNGLEVKSKKYWMRAENNISISFPGNLKIQMDQDEGYFSCQLHFTQNRTLSGSYILLRTDERSNYMEWIPLRKFSYANKNISRNQRIEIYKDYTVAHGVKYKYAIQQYGESFSAKKILCNTLIDQGGNEKKQQIFSLYFEDLFLFDGIKQLKIRFNPKVSNFKDIIIENKIDTIGNKFPFFFRNGRLKYKNFSLEGLITCQMDTQHSFSVEEVPNNNLTQENIHSELDFKLKVLEWLNNGSAKLFRSPTEGNYLVQIIKVSLTPKDQLGRMLHTFKAEAFEIADYNYDNLLKFHIYNKDLYISEDVCHEILSLPEEGNFIRLPKAIEARIVNAPFGTQIVLSFQNRINKAIAIGITGYYKIFIEKDNPLVGITIEKKNGNEGKIEFSYSNKDNSKAITDENNELITNLLSFDKIEQFIGPCDITKQITFSNNPMKTIQIEEIPYLRLQARPIERGWLDEKSNRFFNDVYLIEEIKTQKLPIYLNYNDNQYYELQDDHTFKKLERIDISYLIEIDDENGMKDIRKYILESNYIELSFQEIIPNRFEISSGLYVDIFYYGSSFLKEGSENRL